MMFASKKFVYAATQWTITLALTSTLFAQPSKSPDDKLQSVPANRLSTVPAASQLLFQDEFDGAQLNLTKWYRCYNWADENQGCSYGPPYDLEWFTTRNVSVSGGMLNLTAKRGGKKHPYTSGLVTTGGSPNQPPSFTFQYGYMEMSAKFPAGKGMWPAFWLLPADGSWPPEIDAPEWLGNAPTIDYVTIHWGVDHHGHHPSSQRAYDTKVDLSEGFHTYGLDWQADHVTWYFDGTPIKNFTNAKVIPHTPMYIILNLAVGGWIAPPDGTNHFPATMLVDYVRVWPQKP
jgi:beta-glucanase (GH16 family)